jgi:hypothetical protein
MQLITDEYRSLNKQLHEENKKYGTMGALYIHDLLKILDKLKTVDVLDYGCGKSTLAHNLPFTIKQYDPAIEQYSDLPEPADVVVCTDVLEHIEPELLDNVLAHIASLTKRMAYVTACTCEARKTLADGRNAHLIIQLKEWWEEQFKKHFKLKKCFQGENQIIALLEPKDKAE